MESLDQGRNVGHAIVAMARAERNKLSEDDQGLVEIEAGL
jgi:hypothetical protein